MKFPSKPSKSLNVKCASFLIVIVCVLGSLGCQRNDHAKGSVERVREGKVIGGSMAPHFLGEHLKFQCERCGSEVVADYTQAKDRKVLICPFCGSEQLTSGTRRDSSDRVKIELDNHQIQRWDVIAFQVPDSKEAGIKRVVGLPHESIEIRKGNLWCDGTLIRKSINDQKRTRILIHDSDKTDSSKIVWQAVDSAGLRLSQPSQRFEDGKFVLASPTRGRSESDSAMKWFRFCNQRNYAHNSDSDSSLESEEVEAWPIEDSYGYNQSVSRSLNIVDELFVSFHFTPQSFREIGWKFKRGPDVYSFKVSVKSRELAISVPSAIGKQSKTKVKLSDESFSNSKVYVEFSTIDQMAVVLVAGVQVAQFELKHALTEGQADSQKTAAQETDPEQVFQIGATAESGFESASPFGPVKIWRDVYYLPAQGEGQSQIVTAGADSFLVLGDNVPISVDSRHWPGASVSNNDLIGKVQQRIVD